MHWYKRLQIELGDIDFGNMGDWPVAVKYGLLVLLNLTMLVAGYCFVIQNQYQQLTQAAHKEQNLRQRFELQHIQAANLAAQRRQLADIRESFDSALQQLPKQTEVADLLVEISQMGVASGLTFELFQPQEEILQTFYAELPIKLRVTGSYHAFGEFVSGLATLPRIVTLHDMAIKTDKQRLVLIALAKTYRYLGAGKS